MDDIPILYCYIWRNLKQGCHCECIVNINSVIPYVRKVVHTAPKLVYSDIFKEMEKMRLVRLIGTDKCIILNNSICEKKLRRLKDYIFPISPS